MAGFFSKLFGDYEVEGPEIPEEMNPVFKLESKAGKAAKVDEEPAKISIEDVKKFANSLEFDYKGLNKDQTAIVKGIEHRLEKYCKELEKGGVNEERLSDIAREVFIASCASTKDMKECLKFHEECGFGVEELNNFSKDDKSLNPLSAALAGGRDQKEMKQLIDVGADVNFKSESGNNLSHFAAAIGVEKKMMKFLIDEGVEINAENKYGMTAMDVASLSGNAPLAELLHDKGGKMGSLLSGVARGMRGDSAEGKKTKEEELSEAISRSSLTETNALISEGANVNTVVNGSSALQQAVNTGNVAIASTVSYQANIYTKENVRGETAMMENIVDHVGSEQTQVGQGGNGSGNFSWVEFVMEKMAKEARDARDGGMSI